MSGDVLLTRNSWVLFLLWLLVHRGVVGEEVSEQKEEECGQTGLKREENQVGRNKSDIKYGDEYICAYEHCSTSLFNSYSKAKT